MGEVKREKNPAPDVVSGTLLIAMVMWLADKEEGFAYLSWLGRERNRRGLLAGLVADTNVAKRRGGEKKEGNVVPGQTSRKEKEWRQRRRSRCRRIRPPRSGSEGKGEVLAQEKGGEEEGKIAGRVKRRARRWWGRSRKRSPIRKEGGGFGQTSLCDSVPTEKESSSKKKNKRSA